jgi:hypothetical protein
VTGSRPEVARVVVIGLDGLDPWIVGPLPAAGELPNLARLAPADLAPTLLTLAGLEVPADLPGWPLTSPAAPDVSSPLSDIADPAVLERLSGLGYI